MRAVLWMIVYKGMEEGSDEFVEGTVFREEDGTCSPGGGRI